MRNALVMALVLLVSVPMANADTRAEKIAKAKAKVLIKSGDLNYRLAKFEEALADYQAAYKLYEHPAILFNIAQCHRQLKNHEKALFFYRLCRSDWQRSNPDPTFLKEVRTQIGKLNDVMARDRKAKQEQARLEQERTRKEEERVRQEAARKKEEQARKAKLALIPTPKPRPNSKARPFYKKWWFWTAVGVVVVGATTATVVGLQPGDANTVGGTLRPSNIYLD